ncbi:MAG: hypothetical protein IJT43_01490 [Stomatobaculum sp.]|nr:hypothetical protein [Stomatobaculum sp.]
MKSTQIFLTPNEGKKLIADALASLEFVQEAMQEHTVVVVMGTTNAYLANALLDRLGEKELDMRGFHRGITKPDSVTLKVPADKYDLVIEKGKVIPEKTIFDVVGSLTKDDIIFKGANAVHIASETAGVLIGHPAGGTVLACEQAAVGKRTTLIMPVGVEKRVEFPISDLASMVNDSFSAGLRLYPASGTPFTELDALSDLFDLDAELIAAGGICGAEGGCWFQCEGEDEDIDRLEKYTEELKALPAFEV